MITVDENIRKELNNLSKEEVSWPNPSYAYGHEIVWYGIDAVAHTHLMREAKKIINENLSLEEFIRRYDVQFVDYPGNHRWFMCPLKGIENDGIFIPRHSYWDGEGNEIERMILFFNRDYVNRVLRPTWEDWGYAMKIIDRKWQVSDLKNPELIEQGIRFGKDLWKESILGFEATKNGMSWSKRDKEPQPHKVTDLGEKLIAYYSTIVS